MFGYVSKSTLRIPLSCDMNEEMSITGTDTCTVTRGHSVAVETSAGKNTEEGIMGIIY